MRSASFLRNMGFTVTSIAKRLSRDIGTTDDDQGIFDSRFCHETEEFLLKTLKRFIEENNDKYISELGKCGDMTSTWSYDYDLIISLKQAIQQKVHDFFIVSTDTGIIERIVVDAFNVEDVTVHGVQLYKILTPYNEEFIVSPNTSILVMKKAKQD